MAESITIKSPHEIEIMRQAAKIAAGARSMGRQAVKDGLTTKQIDRAVHEYIVKNGGKPSCLGYEGFPAATCVSVNDEVIHGIPGKRIVRNGDIVSIDLCAAYRGFVGDCAGTYPCGEITEVEIRNHPDRNRLLSCLGVEEEEPAVGGDPEAGVVGAHGGIGHIEGEVFVPGEAFVVGEEEEDEVFEVFALTAAVESGPEASGGGVFEGRDTLEAADGFVELAGGVVDKGHRL